MQLNIYNSTLLVVNGVACNNICPLAGFATKHTLIIFRMLVLLLEFLYYCLVLSQTSYIPSDKLRAMEKLLLETHILTSTFLPTITLSHIQKERNNMKLIKIWFRQ